MDIRKIHSCSAAETHALGKKAGARLKSGAVFCLTGPLGSGKTVFVQGMAEGLGIKSRILSPTFILMREYRLDHSDLRRLYHLDFYRLESEVEAKSLGLSQLFQDPGAVVVIEWGEKMSQVLPPIFWQVTFIPTKNNEREITIEKISAQD